MFADRQTRLGFPRSAAGITELFDTMIHSSKEGIRKPAKRIYEIALERLGVPAQQCIFLDDIAMNLKEPRNMVHDFFQAFAIAEAVVLTIVAA
jgi:FMN phosphatase YigB (HAD superfamily)